MNPGPVEEAGKVTETFMDIMKGQPLALALVVMNVMLMVLLYFDATINRDLRRAELEQQKNVSELLANCVPVDALKDFQPSR
jgi:hypothetical protein